MGQGQECRRETRGARSTLEPSWFMFSVMVRQSEVNM